MYINDVLYNKSEVYEFISSELKELGVKIRKEKRAKTIQQKCGRKTLFKTHLHLLELNDVQLTNGSVVQIPRFVSDACQIILDNIEIEGLFRKAGSSMRQKDIRTNLDYGLQLGNNYHVIDIANVLKLFFRELPEPFIPSSAQETFIQCLLIGGDENIHAILLSCILLPPLTLNTLAYFMQVLRKVSLHSHINKMSIENLSIILTPSLTFVFPNNNNGNKFNNHNKNSPFNYNVEIMKILIEYADMIGVLPESVLRKFNLLSCEITPPKGGKDLIGKKKKRRSGSLTRMFNGIKKFVGAIGSSENLDNSLDNGIVTPCLTKSSKKRKLADNAGFSAKKKKEILDSMPNGNQGILPNTPLCLKEIKKSRLSLGGGRKNLKYPLSDKRWSIVGPNWARSKKDKNDGKTKSKEFLNQIALNASCSSSKSKIDLSISTELQNQKEFKTFRNDNETKLDTDYVRIPKSEYEAIKEKIAAIETRLSQEFGSVTRSLCKSHEKLFMSISDIELDNNLSGPEKVLNKFEKTIEETENIASSSPSTEHLAKRLSRELKIRRSLETRVFRSPSERKIGTIRRRSRERERENIRLSRNKTWHLSSPMKPVVRQSSNELALQLKSSLKRGRPNTLQSGLPPPVATVTKEDEIDNTTVSTLVDKENWIEGTLFFEKINESNLDLTINSTEEFELPSSSGILIHVQPTTPKFVTNIAVNEIKTPMLPPKSIPKRIMTSKTPNKATNLISKKILTTPIEETQNGRASIARLRTQNAGMVLAKAKLFDGLGGSIGNGVGLGNSEKSIEKLKTQHPSIENRRKSPRFIVNKTNNKLEAINTKDKTGSPRSSSSTRARTPRKTLTPKYKQKRQKLSTVANTDDIAKDNQEQVKSDRNKINSLQNIYTNSSNNNCNINNNRNYRSLNSPNNKQVQGKVNKRTTSNSYSSPRRAIRNPR